MSIKTEAWVLHAGEKGAAPQPAELALEPFEFDDPGPEEVLASPLFGCMEGNMGHAVDRKPIDICLARGEQRCVVGNAGVMRIDKCGSAVTTVKEGQYALLFCNGSWDAFGYPKQIFAYDTPGTIGVLARRLKLHELQVIPIPEASTHSLEEWAAFSLRYITAWSNWELAFGTFRLLVDERQLPRPVVWGWGGGVTMGELALAKHHGCDVTQIASTETRLAAIETLGIRPLDRRAFKDLYYDKKRFRKDEEYTEKYLAAEKYFLGRVAEISDGAMVNVFIDFVGAPVLRATLKALAREGVVTTAGWKEGMLVELVRATECIARHQHVHTHYAKYSQGTDAVAFAEQHDWLPPVDGKVYEYEEIPKLFQDYKAGQVGWFPIFKINDI